MRDGFVSMHVGVDIIPGGSLERAVKWVAGLESPGWWCEATGSHSPAMTGEEINGPSSKLVRIERARNARSPMAGLQTELRSSRGHTFSRLIRGVRQS